MKPLTMILVCAILFSGIGYVTGQKAADGVKEYPVEQGYKQSNCTIYQIKNLQAATTEGDYNRQQVDIQTAHAYAELALLGAEC